MHKQIKAESSFILKKFFLSLLSSFAIVYFLLYIHWLTNNKIFVKGIDNFEIFNLMHFMLIIIVLMLVVCIFVVTANKIIIKDENTIIFKSILFNNEIAIKDITGIRLSRRITKTVSFAFTGGGVVAHYFPGIDNVVSYIKEKNPNIKLIGL